MFGLLIYYSFLAFPTNRKISVTIKWRLPRDKGSDARGVVAVNRQSRRWGPDRIGFGGVGGIATTDWQVSSAWEVGVGEFCYSNPKSFV